MTCHHMLYLYVMELETWYVMFIRPPVGNMAACTQPRHVYVDLGVNWGNTRDDVDCRCQTRQVNPFGVSERGDEGHRIACDGRRRERRRPS